ncbi:DMT family transporter [Chelativorans sp. J32]|uniref:DMT family transporter n=1 Tax=Chelativorans sp. J32 TaxID=935840 RepID=UPI0004804C40|nr:DMT family transporter [Chelativorans sp. J32]
MKSLWHSALALLIVNGALLGLTPPLGKLATEAGVPAAIWSFVISFGAGAVLLCAAFLSERRFKLTARRLRYFAVVGAVSFAFPNVLLFLAVPHLGAGYTGIMFTLTPVMTLILSLLLGVRRPNRLGMLGIAIGFVGALTVATTRGEVGRPAEILWVLVGLSMPVCLAIGNVYRTLDWPEGAGPIELAAGSHLAAAAMLLVAALLQGQAGSFALLADVPLLALGQAVAASVMYTFFFRLQAVGGPVYLSQIGYVAAAVGLAIGVIFLGERYSALTWIGAAILAVGVLTTTKAQSRPG